MITKTGYSKNEGIPEAITITFGKEMMEEQGGAELFLQNFKEVMAGDNACCYWMHKCSNLPKYDVDTIYIIVHGKLWGKVYNGGYKRYDPGNPKTGFSADGIEKRIDWNYITLCGPLTLCPFERELKGFRGFRYSEKLF